MDEGGNQATLPQQSAIRELLLTDEIIEDLVEMQDNERMEDMSADVQYLRRQAEEEFEAFMQREMEDEERPQLLRGHLQDFEE